MARRRNVVGWILTGLFASAAFQACSADSTSPDGGASVSGRAGTAGAAQNDGMVVAPPEGSGAGGESPYDPLCGVSDDGCIPDYTTGDRSCTPGTSGAPSGSGATGGSGVGGTQGGRGGAGSSGAGRSGAGGTGAESGAAGEGGQGGMSSGAGEGASGEPAASGAPAAPGGEGGAGGVPNETGGDDAGGASLGGAAGAGAPSGEAGSGVGISGTNGASGGSTSVSVPRSCQVELVRSEPRAVCAPSGQGKTSTGCFSSADCAPGLACVGATSPGQCRPYCCTGDSACDESGTHCTVQPLVGPTRPDVPVCMPATGCSLAEEYPCEDDATCSCPSLTVCIVVTADGQTSCVPTSSLPGEGHGEAGQACPCAWDHVCSPDTDRCAKLCQTAAPGDACNGTRCQFAAGLPPGWGVCLISSADAG